MSTHLRGNELLAYATSSCWIWGMRFPLRLSQRAHAGVGIAAFSCALLTGCADDVVQPYLRLEGPAPQIENAPSARALLVAFWATWCAPCQEETPELRALAARPPAGLVVVVASHDQSMTTVESFFGGPADAVLHLRIDQGRLLARALNVETLPVSILIVDGRLVARFDGRRRWSSRAERDLLTRLIAGSRRRAIS